ncbi:MAG TPA: hypothetical protein DDX05_02400 [Deltaproteobacteria bacterium]|nr:MAG: hypothetical protein A2X90_10115 [Deltaproteobacteria bacterium GWA2_65_63]OGP29210.1 MAG: hypothetical protein A2X91_01255 [Deltaproteobacteria bacterium GWB2_65_81]OGP36920.1 MAG: hypothetical protein A2X98_04780 [Deltaproteobacteria bacterium GWC2_66_88]HAM33958.1 hypothetical protein [Deltaproteobacteria bacterium]HBG72482.1 hypothetical protein [Deltaproteobacteria bacterium]
MTGEKSGAACTFCGQPITGEVPEQSNPCEYCSSPSGGYLHSILLTEAIGGPATGYVEGATYPQILLSISRFLLDKNDDKLCGIATIMMHVACEVAIERTLSDSFARKGIRSLEESVAGVLNGYNLANDKVRDLYTSLTGDEIQEQPFWDSFIRSAKRRDHIIRKGLIVSRTDAEESFQAANDFLAHMGR